MGSHCQPLMLPGRLAMHRLPSDVRFRTDGSSVDGWTLFPEGILSRRVLACRKFSHLSVAALDEALAQIDIVNQVSKRVVSHPTTEV